MSVGRPRTPLGTAGRITTTPQVQDESGRWVKAPPGVRPQRWQARTRVRDVDGQSREVTKTAPTKGRAVTAVKVALQDRHAPSGRTNELREGMRLLDAIPLFLERKQREQAAASTLEQYKAATRRWIEPSTLSGLTLREANRVPVLRGALEQIADAHGDGAAKTAKSVLSGTLSMAVRDGVLGANAARDVGAVHAKTRKVSSHDTTRALTRAERDHVFEVAEAGRRHHDRDIVDLVHWMGALGVRRAEALDQSWDDVDLDAGTVLVRGTKTDGSVRTLPMPSWLVERMRVRLETRGVAPSRLVFPGPVSGKRRDDRGFSRHMQDLFVEAGFPWATSHSLRRTVASLLDDAGLPTRVAADMLGHADVSMTQRHYLGRRADLSAAAALL